MKRFLRGIHTGPVGFRVEHLRVCTLWVQWVWGFQSRNILQRLDRG